MLNKESEAIMNNCVACGKQISEGNHICNDCTKEVGFGKKSSNKIKEIKRLAEIGAATEEAFNREFTLYCCSDIRRDYEIKSIQELLEFMKEGFVL